VEQHSLAEFLSGSTVRDGLFRQTGFAESTLAGTLCLVARPKYAAVANANPNCTCAITTPDIVPELRQDLGVAISGEPARLFYDVHNELVRNRGMNPEMPVGVAASARIHPTAVVEDHCFIGENVTIDALAVVKRNSWLAEGVFIGAGAAIGVEGHFYKRFDGRLYRVEHGGGVRIGARTEVLAHAIVQKALHMDFTCLGEDVVLGPGSHVAHGVKVGDRTTVAGGAQVAGYTEIGEDVWIGPAAVITNRTSIGARARVEVGAVVGGPVGADARFSGAFAVPHIQNLRAQARLLRGETHPGR
jgi:UDP-3-O-[3-hydroxymyristoyl] glucosamine N-acyltransferase